MTRAMGMAIAGFAALGASTWAGCADGSGEEDVSSIQEAFNATQCATASSSAVFSGLYSWNSASNYSTSCNAVDETTGGGAEFSRYLYRSRVNPNKLPTTQAACTSVYIRSAFYVNVGSGWGTPVKDESHNGVWGGTGCTIQETSFPSGRVAVRVATTVRRPSGSSFVTIPFTTSFDLR